MDLTEVKSPHACSRNLCSPITIYFVYVINKQRFDLVPYIP